MEFMLGANYWASHAGTEMWARWDKSVVERDFKTLSENGLKYLRVFPNWRDFQPVCAFYGVHNTFYEYRDAKGNLFDNPYYVDYTMFEHFKEMCALAEKYGLKLIVGILTGWMSGRLFVPEVLGGVNLITDTTALSMEQKFIKAFVSDMYGQPAIYAWDLGNECNCMSTVQNSTEAENWTSVISNAIRANDPSGKPIVSGMHSLGIENTGWLIKDQAEHTDILTTHPYPQFVPHCFKDNMLSFRTLLHATCETSYYADIGKKPCLAEEIGTLGPMTCGEDEILGFVRTNLFSGWANGSMGLLWWCACEQVELETAPYSWIMMERELGMLDRFGKPKKVLTEFKKFGEFLKSFGTALPPTHSDAVCIASKGQDQWGTAYMTYLLAKQAGLNITYAHYNDELPESGVYMLPSISGYGFMSKERFDKLIERVQNGATLYISQDDGTIAEFERLTGVHIKNSYMENAASGMELDGCTIEFKRRRKNVIETSEALLYDLNGEPVLAKHSLGKGTIYFLNFPLESMLLDESEAFKKDYCKLYSYIFADVIAKHEAHADNKFTGLTLHRAENGDIYAVIVNYSDTPQNSHFTAADGYEIANRIYGDENSIPVGDAAVLLIRKKGI